MPSLTQPNPSEEPRARVEALFRQYHGLLVGFAHRWVRSRDIAEELVQEVFLDLWERCEQGYRLDTPKAYLFAAVRNAASSYLRHQSVVQRFEPETIAIFSRHGPSPDSAVHSAEFAAALERAIAQLPERCRLVFTMSREQGLTYAEIAGLLEISTKTVDTYMGRAYKTLRKALAVYRP